MKINQVVSEHKKGRRAIKYTKKPINTIGPAKPIKPGKPLEEDATLSTGKVVANDGKTITVAMPDGTQIQKPITAAIAKDPQGKPVFNLASAPQAGAVPGAPAQPQTPQQQFPTGSTMPVNTGAPMEEENHDDIGGDPTDQFISDVEDKEFTRAQRGPRYDRKADDDMLEKMRMIAGVK